MFPQQRERRHSFGSTTFSAPLPPLNAALSGSHASARCGSASPSAATAANLPSALSSYDNLQLAPIDRRRSFLSSSAGSGSSSDTSSGSRAPSPVPLTSRQSPAFSSSPANPLSSISAQPPPAHHSLRRSSGSYHEQTRRSQSPISTYRPASCVPSSTAMSQNQIPRSSSGFGAPSRSSLGRSHSLQQANYAFPAASSPKSSTSSSFRFGGSSAFTGAGDDGMTSPTTPSGSGGAASSGALGGNKTRSTFSPHQITVLEHLLSKAMYPSSQDIEDTKRATGMVSPFTFFILF